MSDADRAYELAQEKIAETKRSGATELDFSGEAFRALDQLPPEIGNLTDLQSVVLDGTQITDLTLIAGLTGLRQLSVQRTKVDDLRPIAGLSMLGTSMLPDTKLTVSMAVFDGLSFDDTPATERDAHLAELASISHDQERTLRTLEYLRALPPWPEPYTPDTPPKGGGARQKHTIKLTSPTEAFLTKQLVKTANNARLEQVAKQVDDLQQFISDTRAQLAGNLEAITTLSSLTKKIADLENQLAKTADKAATQQSYAKEQDAVLLNLRRRLESFEADVESRIANADKNYAESMAERVNDFETVAFGL